MNIIKAILCNACLLAVIIQPQSLAAADRENRLNAGLAALERDIMPLHSDLGCLLLRQAIRKRKQM